MMFKLEYKLRADSIDFSLEFFVIFLSLNFRG